MRFAALLGILALGGTLFTILRPSTDPAARTLDQSLPSGATGRIAAYLKAHTSPDDTVFAVYGPGDIYYLAQRRPAARWLHWNELATIPGAFDEQIALLTEPSTAPRYIALVHDFGDFSLDGAGRMASLVARDYVLETTIDGIPIYRRAH